ncbi:MAG: histidine ammonia-lyase [Calditrichaeota bacterium]|nr:histidine ammonia-lyase [Calditrichota bacterium]RQW06368.1 MAG: histidine ammonia-lyase [Calditrichota bacterium]
MVLDGNSLTLEDLIQASRDPAFLIQLDENAIERIQKSRAWVDSVQKNGSPVVYGINTGFGSKATVTIDREKLKDLQRNLIMSHAAGAGNPLEIGIVRAAMLMRINTFAKGHSGVRMELVETVIRMLEAGVTPWVPEQGSLGASGDLAPLSHIGLVISRGVKRDHESESGQAYYLDPESNSCELMSGTRAMQKAGIPRIVLEAKEGLALNNGTQISTAILASTLYDALRVIRLADVAMAMSLEALEGISRAFREELHALRPHPGQIRTASNIRRLTEGSRLMDRHPEKVQDAYSLRCHPQVIAGVRDALDYIGSIVKTEINATTDNPVIFPELSGEDKAISGGNFHAQPVGFAADLMAMVLCEVGSIAERRIFKLSDKNLNGGLPSFLTENSGLESGLMLAQYTAAALVSENKSLAFPASIDSIPTCENQEDHVSMAPVAARKASTILTNLQKIIGIEMLYAAQALDFRLREMAAGRPEEILGKGTAVAYRFIRESIPFLKEDRPVYLFIEKANEIVRSGEILATVEKTTGQLD